MTRAHVSASLAAQVLADAGHRCGYCHTDEHFTGMACSIEHIVPVSRGGQTRRENLWRSCRDCNERKGAQITSRDPLNQEMAALFNPRTQHGNDHFQWSTDGMTIDGTTATGRATVIALDLNRPLQCVARQRWVQAGWHPPDDDTQHRD